MDLNAIRARLDSLNKQSNPQKKEKKDYTLIYWKPKQEGKYQIRFVPTKLDLPYSTISRSIYALWSWEISNCCFNKLG